MQKHLVDEPLVEQLRQIFSTQLIHPVELIYFSNQTDCLTCDETVELLTELAAISDKLHLSTYDQDEQPSLAEQYKIVLTPSLVIAENEHGKLTDHGIRFAGIPSGYEFGSLIEAITMVSRRDSGLKPAVRSELKKLGKPIQLKVFVTPT